MNFLIACNWKLYLTHNEAVDWITTNHTPLDELADINHNIVICPSYESLTSIKEKLPKSIYLGAQDCSAYESGSYTGQVSAKSLAEVGCAYSIIGHSETRIHLAQDNSLVAEKIKLALKNDLFPIIALGEPLAIYKEQKTDEYLKNQMAFIIKTLSDQGTAQEVYLAYEPIWAIGSGISAQPEYIQHVFNFIKQEIELSRLPHTIKFLYGGSVKSDNAEQLLKINHLNGFLIGKASTDFQELKKIVSLVNNQFV